MSQNMSSTDAAMRTGQMAMDTAHGECNSVLTNVEQIRGTLSGGWQGGAATQFDGALNRWLENLRLITNDMNDMIGILGGTERNFNQMEEDNMITSNFMSELNPAQPAQPGQPAQPAQFTMPTQIQL